ncbi:MAG TPA: hypothetical protein VND22_06330 [Actinomycetota bacterium]|nr:hypothetical protein [Actinomycetota bacterium]
MKSKLEPLSVLVSRVLVPLVWELDDGSNEASLAVWADLLRVVPDEGALQQDLLALAHVSPRSMNVLVSAAVKLGLVTIVKVPKGPLTPTKKGHAARRAWDAHLAAVEKRWRREHKTAPLIAALARLMEGIEVELPWLLLPYGPADNSASIGPPVPRQPLHDGLPLLALLSQLLAALALSYESKHGWMLSMMSTTFDGFPDEGLPMEDVPAFAGVKGNGKTLHERHGILTVEPMAGQPRRKIVKLTEKGVRFRDLHLPTIESVEREWAAQDGLEALAHVRRELSRVAAGLPTRHVRHLCMQYRGGEAAFTEVSPRS